MYCTPPPVEDFNFDNFENNVDENFIKLMTMQKQLDDQKPDKAGIGGEIHRLILMKNASKLDIIHRFPDYEMQYRQMLRKLSDLK